MGSGHRSRWRGEGGWEGDSYPKSHEQFIIFIHLSFYYHTRVITVIFVKIYSGFALTAE